MPAGSLGTVDAESILRSRGVDKRAAQIILGGGAVSHVAGSLPDMAKGCDVVERHIDDQKKFGRAIAIYGDFDADGVTACTILTTALREAGAEVIPYIPNRMADGYGLHADALERLVEMHDVRCVITVDCGTSSADVVAGRPPGLGMIITDHHLPSPTSGGLVLPDADAVINPKLPDSRYPFDGLAGAGVALKMVEELERRGTVPAGTADRLVCWAAIGTVCDVMPLQDENLSLVRRGLAQMNTAPPLGLDVLRKALGLRGEMTASDIAFFMGPALNAAGRMEDAEVALRLCLTNEIKEAEECARYIVSLNNERKAAVAVALTQADPMVAALPDDMQTVVLGSEEWSIGIVGLIAGRMAEKYGRPSVAIAFGDEVKGSIRSVAGANVVDVLAAIPDGFLEKFGGHAAAAGFTLCSGVALGDFRGAFEGAFRRTYGERDALHAHRADAVVHLRDISTSLCDELSRLEPCGAGNRAPVLAVLGCQVVSASPLGKDSRHVKLFVSEGGGGKAYEAVAWNKPFLAARLRDYLPPGHRVDLLFTPGVNEWRGKKTVQLVLRDIRPAQTVNLEAVVAGEPVSTAIERAVLGIVEPVGALNPEKQLRLGI